MTTVSQNIGVVMVAVICLLLFMGILNRVCPPEKRRAYNDLIGWQASILGTSYAVILGFMLYAVWTSYGEADLNVDREASALLDVYHLTDGLPEPQRTQLETQARSYADVVVKREVWARGLWCTQRRTVEGRAGVPLTDPGGFGERHLN